MRRSAGWRSAPREWPDARYPAQFDSLDRPGTLPRRFGADPPEQFDLPSRPAREKAVQVRHDDVRLDPTNVYALHASHATQWPQPMSNNRTSCPYRHFTSPPHEPNTRLLTDVFCGNVPAAAFCFVPRLSTPEPPQGGSPRFARRRRRVRVDRSDAVAAGQCRVEVLIDNLKFDALVRNSVL